MNSTIKTRVLCNYLHFFVTAFLLGP